jgi:hypothetical protein
MASQRDTNHTAHQGGGTRSPQVLTALLGLTELSGVTADKILWEPTGHKCCHFFTGSLDVHTHGSQGQRGAQPSTVADVVQLCGVVRIDRGGQFSGENRTAQKRCQFFPDPGMPVQKRGRYSPWRLWAELQPPPVRGVIAHTQNFSGENRTAQKRCRFFLGPGMPVQKRGCNSPWCPWAKPQPPPVGGIITHLNGRG